MSAVADAVAFEWSYRSNPRARGLSRREYASYLLGYRDLYGHWPI